jgi:hypothetical protein
MDEQAGVPREALAAGFAGVLEVAVIHVGLADLLVACHRAQLHRLRFDAVRDEAWSGRVGAARACRSRKSPSSMDLAPSVTTPLAH